MPDILFPFAAEPAIVMLTMQGCPFCDLARRYLDAAGIPYSEIKVDDPMGRRALYDRWASEHPMAKHRSFPAVFAVWGNDVTLLGGFQDIEAARLAEHWPVIAGTVPPPPTRLDAVRAAQAVDEPVQKVREHSPA